MTLVSVPAGIVLTNEIRWMTPYLQSDGLKQDLQPEMGFSAVLCRFLAGIR